MSFLQKFKNLSVKNIAMSVWQMMQRFPLVVVNTILVTGISVYTVQMEKTLPGFNFDTEMKIVMMLALSLPLLLTASLAGERFKLQKWYTYAIQAGTLGVLVLYYFSLPAKLSEFTTNDHIRYALLQVISYLLLLVAPWFESKQNNAEWSYIENLFVRLFTTGVFSATLFGGLALSLWSIDYLFGVHWRGQTYMQIWIVIAGIFATWFYLSTFPKSLDEYEEKKSVPAVLRVFVSYILVPLLALFYVILYTYVGKILITWNWPMGGVATWVLAFSIVGVLTYLMGYLLQKEMLWLKKFFQVFFILIIPLAIVLFMAVGMRISEYGVTENRYLIVLFGIWLIAVALYYLLSKQKQVKFAPTLTAIFFFISLFGPWSMFHISEKSQFNQLEKLLVENKILINGKVQKISEKDIDPKVAGSIRSKTQYVVNHNGYEKIQPWFNQNLKVHSYDNSTIGEVYSYEISQNALQAMGIQDVYYRPDIVTDEYFSLFTKEGSPTVFETEGYKYVLVDADYFAVKGGASSNRSYKVGEKNILFTTENNIFRVKEGEKTFLEVDLTASVQKWLQEYKENTARIFSSEELSFTAENASIKMKMYVSSVNGNTRNGLEVEGIRGNILFTLK